MKTTKLLQITSIFVLLQYSAHTFLFLSAKPTHGPEEITLVEAMKSHYWDFGGFSHSYWDFYFGYGLIAILLGVIEVVLLWQLASISKISSVKIRPFIALLFFATLAHAILILKYFFLLPAIFDFITVLLLGVAYMRAKENTPSNI